MDVPTSAIWDGIETVYQDRAIIDFMAMAMAEVRKGWGKATKNLFDKTATASPTSRARLCGGVRAIVHFGKPKRKAPHERGEFFRLERLTRPVAFPHQLGHPSTPRHNKSPNKSEMPRVKAVKEEVSMLSAVRDKVVKKVFGEEEKKPKSKAKKAPEPEPEPEVEEKQNENEQKKKVATDVVSKMRKLQRNPAERILPVGPTTTVVTNMLKDIDDVVNAGKKDVKPLRLSGGARHVMVRVLEGELHRRLEAAHTINSYATEDAKARAKVEKKKRRSKRAASSQEVGENGESEVKRRKAAVPARGRSTLRAVDVAVASRLLGDTGNWSLVPIDFDELPEDENFMAELKKRTFGIKHAHA